MSSADNVPPASNGSIGSNATPASNGIIGSNATTPASVGGGSSSAASIPEWRAERAPPPSIRLAAGTRDAGDWGISTPQAAGGGGSASTRAVGDWGISLAAGGGGSSSDPPESMGATRKFNFGDEFTASRVSRRAPQEVVEQSGGPVYRASSVFVVQQRSRTSEERAATRASLMAELGPGISKYDEVLYALDVLTTEHRNAYPDLDVRSLEQLCALLQTSLAKSEVVHLQNMPLHLRDGLLRTTSLLTHQELPGLFKELDSFLGKEHIREKGCVGTLIKGILGPCGSKERQASIFTLLKGACGRSTRFKNMELILDGGDLHCVLTPNHREELFQSLRAALQTSELERFVDVQLQPVEDGLQPVPLAYPELWRVPSRVFSSWLLPSLRQSGLLYFRALEKTMEKDLPRLTEVLSEWSSDQSKLVAQETELSTAQENATKKAERTTCAAALMEVQKLLVAKSKAVKELKAKVDVEQEKLSTLHGMATLEATLRHTYMNPFRDFQDMEAELQRESDENRARLADLITRIGDFLNLDNARPPSSQSTAFATLRNRCYLLCADLSETVKEIKQESLMAPQAALANARVDVERFEEMMRALPSEAPEKKRTMVNSFLDRAKGALDEATLQLQIADHNIPIRLMVQASATMNAAYELCKITPSPWTVTESNMVANAAGELVKLLPVCKSEEVGRFNKRITALRSPTECHIPMCERLVGVDREGIPRLRSALASVKGHRMGALAASIGALLDTHAARQVDYLHAVLQKRITTPEVQEHAIWRCVSEEEGASKENGVLADAWEELTACYQSCQSWTPAATAAFTRHATSVVTIMAHASPSVIDPQPLQRLQQRLATLCIPVPDWKAALVHRDIMRAEWTDWPLDPKTQEPTKPAACMLAQLKPELRLDSRIKLLNVIVAAFQDVCRDLLAGSNTSSAQAAGNLYAAAGAGGGGGGSPSSAAMGGGGGTESQRDSKKEKSRHKHGGHKG